MVSEMHIGLYQRIYPVFMFDRVINDVEMV